MSEKVNFKSSESLPYPPTPEAEEAITQCLLAETQKSKTEISTNKFQALEKTCQNKIYEKLYTPSRLSQLKNCSQIWGSPEDFLGSSLAHLRSCAETLLVEAPIEFELRLEGKPVTDPKKFAVDQNRLQLVYWFYHRPTSPKTPYQTAIDAKIRELRGPAKIVVNLEEEQRRKEGEYNRKTKEITLFKTTDPAGILQHEKGHLLMDLLYDSGIPPYRTRRRSRSRGWGEGFADFISILGTGNDYFLDPLSSNPRSQRMKGWTSRRMSDQHIVASILLALVLGLDRQAVQSESLKALDRIFTTMKNVKARRPLGYHQDMREFLEDYVAIFPQEKPKIQIILKAHRSEDFLEPS